MGCRRHGTAPASVLPAGIRSRILPGINGLDIHVLEAGYETKGRPPCCYARLSRTRLELAQDPAGAGRAGYHAIAPDHRGYGRTSSTPIDYDADLSGFRFLNLLRRRDRRALRGWGHRTVEAVVGHDFGAAVASFLALVRPTSSSAWC